MVNSAEALVGTLNFGQAGILAGDLQSPFTAGSPREPCIFVDGGFVSVKWDPVIAPSEAEGFTVEAWVHTGWGNKDLAFDRAVVGSIELTGGLKGFGILATKDQTWQAFVGNGSDVTFVTGAAVATDTDYHLVATYAAGELTLYVNGSPTSTSATYAPTTGVVRRTRPPGSLSGAAGRTCPRRGNRSSARSSASRFTGAHSRMQTCKSTSTMETPPRSGARPIESRAPRRDEMSTSLLVMIPFVLLAIVSSLCFVGCVLNTRGSAAGRRRRRSLNIATTRCLRTATAAGLLAA